ncbi:actin binding motor protein [Lithospermum erythrorhizon]|uniref:Actin binding motor protein n=1 Tax=Lithospermum erythrorhizon TaxID=34254 RepID=A0AAV3Q8T6_LITER
MSWLKRAVHYADSVVQQAGQAVAEGAKIIQHRIGSRSYMSFKQTVRRLEEASASCRGPERVLLIKRWLIALKETEMLPTMSLGDNERKVEHYPTSDEVKEGSKKKQLVLFFDPDMGEPMTFLDVFLYSKALEGISICMILEAPNEEEVSLLLELFGFCLTGRKEVHNAIVSSIKDLATAFSSYQDEVLVKQEELIQFAEAAITGLKVNADLRRIDVEASMLKRRLDEIRAAKETVVKNYETAIKEPNAPTIEDLREALAHIRICSRLEGLLLKKKSLKSEEPQEVHAQKVDKLKILSESLANSALKSEKRISEQRSQKEDALRFRMTKTNEVSDVEKEIEAEVSGLEKQRDEIEAQLKKVNISLAAAKGCLHNAREERDQFYEANDEIVAHLKTKEDELSRSISSSKAEAGVLSTWINFLEDTWKLQCSHSELKDKEINEELERHEMYFEKLVIQLLSNYERDLRPSIDRIEKYVKNLKSLSEGSLNSPNIDPSVSLVLSPRRNLEEEYLDYEAKIITTFSVVDNMREQFTRQEKISRKDESKIQGLFDNIEKLREQFESIERPNLAMETPPQEAEAEPVEKPNEEFHPESEPREAVKVTSTKPQESVTTSVAHEAGKSKHPKQSEHVLDTEAELAKMESEFGKVNTDYSAEEEVGDWEFDELERELKIGDGK